MAAIVARPSAKLMLELGRYTRVIVVFSWSAISKSRCDGRRGASTPRPHRRHQRVTTDCIDTTAITTRRYISPMDCGKSKNLSQGV